MSIELYERAKAREALIYKHAEVDILKAAGHNYLEKPVENNRFDLESHRILQDIYVLTDSETLKLYQLDAFLDLGLSRIASNRVILLARIASKRVLKQYDYALMAKKLTVHEYANLVAEELMAAKEATLALDIAEVATLALKVEIYIEETALKIKELEAKISEEVINLAKAEMEVLETQLNLAKMDQKIAQEMLRVMQLQVDIFNTIYEASMVGVKVAGIKAEIIGLTSAIARTKVSSYHLTAEQAKLNQDLSNIAKKLAADLQRIAISQGILNADLANNNKYFAAMAALIVAEIAAGAVKTAIAQYALTLAQTSSTAEQSSATKNVATDVAINQAHIEELVSNQNRDAEINEKKREGAIETADAVIRAAEKEAAITVTASVMHNLLFSDMPPPVS